MRKLGLLLLIGLLTLSSLFGCTNTQPDNTKELTYDVVVVGGGAAGLSASIEAAKAGAKVVLIEKLPMVGGSTMLSGGIVYGTGYKIQKDAGIEDSVDALVQYWLEKSNNVASEPYLRFVAEKSGETIDWLVELGVEFGEPYATGTSPVLRAVSTSNHGNGLIEPLKATAEANGVEFFLQTSATKLIKDGDKVVGVEAVDSEGNPLVINTKAVILATGGFDRNSELVTTYASVAQGQTTFSGVGNTGDGLVMAKEAGADVVSNGGVIGFRAVEGESAYTTDICLLMWMPYLYVNLDGKRFVNETIDYPLFYEELIKQRDGVSYLIFDQNTYSPALDKAVEKGSAFVSDSLEDLATQAGINPTEFVNTVNNYNQMIDNGVDTEFGKAIVGYPKVNAPKYYAVKVVPAVLGTMSGIKTDLNAQVLDTNGQPIEGLFAAGELANGDFFNRVYPASGTSIQMSVTFGRVAGVKAAELVK